MKLYLIATLFLISMAVILSYQPAEAQIAANKAYSLTGNGFAVSERSITDTNIELIFTSGQKKTNVDLSLSSMLFATDGKEMTISGFSGTALRNGQIITISSTATGSDGKQYSLKALGRLVGKTTTDSIYTISGTLTDPSRKSTKLFYTAMISEFAITPTQTTQKSDVVVKILKGAANPEDRTYIDQQAGFSFRYLSEDRLTVPPGTKITFINEDTQSHSLESGTANYNSRKKTFTSDGKISSGEILPGRSWTVTFDEQGFYRLFDKKYQWIDITIFVIDSSKVQSPKTQIN